MSSDSFSDGLGGVHSNLGVMFKLTMARRRKAGISGFGARLRRVREERELSQAELARLASLTPVDISRYERHEVLPTIDNFSQLVQALDVPADVLLFETP